MTENPDARPEPIVVAEFEGEYVRLMEGKLPALNLMMDEGYPRGTHLKLAAEVRVRNVRYEEIVRGEHKGDLVRQHIFALEELQLVSAHSPDELDPGVGGSASLRDPWWPMLRAFLTGETDELDFEGEEIPDRLHEMVKAYFEEQAASREIDPGF